MITIRDYVFASSVDEAVTILNKSKTATVLGGITWLHLSTKNIGTAIDLSHLGLDKIEETEEELSIGAMVTLRKLETSVEAETLFNGVLKKCVKHIVGVQFRNMATIGASVFSKYGFSDIITTLLALETEVELAISGRMSLEKFLESPYKKDILLRIHIKKQKRIASYQTFRLTATDFPILSVCVSKFSDDVRISVGARPSVAKRAIISEKIGFNNQEEIAESVCKELTFGTNQRATKEYRKNICKVLVKRALEEVENEVGK